MKKILELTLCCRTVRDLCKLNLYILRKKQVAFETKYLGNLGPKTWNKLSYYIKSVENGS